MINIKNTHIKIICFNEINIYSGKKYTFYCLPVNDMQFR